MTHNKLYILYQYSVYAYIHTPTQTQTVHTIHQLSSVQLLSCVWLFEIPRTEAHARLSCPSPSLELAQLISIKSVMPSTHLILCRPLLLLPSIFLSIRVFPNQSVICIRWPKYWGFSFSFLPMNTQDWFPLGWTGWISLLSKGVKSLPQHYSSKASILWHSAFFTVQLSYPYMTHIHT